MKTVLELAVRTGTWVFPTLAEIRQLAPPGQPVSIVATNVGKYETWAERAEAADVAVTFVADVDILDNGALAKRRAHDSQLGWLRGGSAETHMRRGTEEG